MPRGTPENLQPVRSKSEARERGRKGGIASGIARREKAARKIRIKEIAELAVDKAILPEYIQNMDGQADFATVVDLRLFELCKQGNIAAMKLWYELYGTDPVLQQRIREVDLKHKQFEFEKEKWKAEKDTQGAAYSDIIEYFSRICEADDDGSVQFAPDVPAIAQIVDWCVERRKVWKQEPLLFSREMLRMKLDRWQVNVLEDLAERSMVSVRSGQGVGKTTVESIAMIWFLWCFPYARIVATAPTLQQLSDVLWSEASKWISTNPLLKYLLVWTKTRIYARGYEERWFAVARTATKPENMQGFHADNMLFIVDEASGVSDPIMEVIHGTLSGANNKLLMCGNPTRTSGFFMTVIISTSRCLRPIKYLHLTAAGQTKITSSR